jgi:4-hydroxy-tetrahydrodipicolinate synthase
VDGIVPVGTTGESPTLSYEEHIEVIRLSVKFADGKTKVIAGTGGNSTSEAIYLTKAAEEVGADASLQVAPTTSRRKVSFSASTRSRGRRLPIILYSIPGRCGIEIGVETVNRLARHRQRRRSRRQGTRIRSASSGHFGAGLHHPSGTIR